MDKYDIAFIIILVMSMVMVLLFGLREKIKIRDAETVGTLFIINTEDDTEPLVYISIKSFEDLDGKDYVKVNVVRESHNEQRPL